MKLKIKDKYWKIYPELDVNTEYDYTIDLEKDYIVEHICVLREHAEIVKDKPKCKIGDKFKVIEDCDYTGRIVTVAKIKYLPDSYDFRCKEYGCCWAIGTEVLPYKEEESVISKWDSKEYKAESVIEKLVKSWVNAGLVKVTKTSTFDNFVQDEEHAQIVDKVLKTQYDYIKPNHYKLWEDMEDTFEPHKKLLTKEEYIGFLRGNILKYQLRLGKKPNEPVERDLKKIEVYQEELSKQLNK
jgi:hypothetical protein